MTPNRVLVVDDHPIVRLGLAQMINRESDLEVCGEVDVRSSLHSIALLKPDLIVTDISPTGPAGLEIIRSIRQKYQELRILVLSMHDEMVYAERGLQAGANGYAVKQDATETILLALRTVLKGEIYVSERVAKRMQKRFVGCVALSPFSAIDDLTGREMEVFRLLGEGHGTREISDALHLSVKTVETYQAHLKEKLGLRNARELAQCAIEWVISEGSSVERTMTSSQ